MPSLLLERVAVMALLSSLPYANAFACSSSRTSARITCAALIKSCATSDPTRTDAPKPPQTATEDALEARSNLSASDAEMNLSDYGLFFGTIAGFMALFYIIAAAFGNL